MTNYPNNVDSDLELPRVENNVTAITDTTINSIRDAVIAIETTVGINPQGNTPCLADRINAAIDLDGNIKASAIENIGLVTLPITNAEIATDAGIKESKLDLDYATTTLNTRISSAQTNITTLNSTLANLQSSVSQHYIGTTGRHTGEDIDLEVSVRGEDTVESALHEVDDDLSAHETNISSTVHQANTISVVDNFSDFSSTDVQDALEKLDASRLGKIETHQSNLHINAIENNSLNESGQGNLVDTTLASTIFKTNTSVATNILQVMNPSSARVTSKDLNLRALGVGVATTLRVQAGGVNRTYLDINLSVAPSAIPTQNVDDIVDKINSIAHSASNHYPISAYNTNGKLTIAHNIPGKDFTIQILNATSLSAATALGFGDVISTVFEYPNGTRAAYINGMRVINFEPLVKISYTGATSTALVSPGLGNLNNLGLTTTPEGSILCNITNHSVDSTVNGTYYIASYPSTSTFLLNTAIAAGTFDLEILACSVNFANSSSGKLYDIFLGLGDTDGYGIVSKQQRIAYESIPYIALRAISKDFSTSNTAWEVNSDNNLVLYEGALAGVAVNIPAGYIGPIEVFAPNNVDSAIFEVYGNPTFLSRTFVVSSFYESDDCLYLSSVHYSGNFGTKTLKYVTDRRQLGGSAENISKDILLPNSFTNALSGLRSNGVIFGLDVVSSSSSAFTLRGGQVLVDGNIFNISTQDIVINNFVADTWILLVDNKGSLVIKSETSDPGFSISDLIFGDSYGDNRNVALIVEFTTDGSILTGNFVDKRLIISKIDKKLWELTSRVDNISDTFFDGHDGYVIGVSGYPLTVTDQMVAFHYSTSTLQLSGQNLTVKPSGISHTGLAPSTLLTDDHTQYLLLAGRNSGQEIIGDLSITGGIVNSALKTALDGYASGGSLPAGILDGYETIANHNADMVLIRTSCDGYGRNFTAQSIWNNTVRSSLDGYETIANHNADMVLIRTACDGYTSGGSLPAGLLDGYETIANHNADMVIIRTACDGYTSGGSLPAGILDGYIPYTGASDNVVLGLHTLTVDAGICAQGTGYGEGLDAYGGSSGGYGIKAFGVGTSSGVYGEGGSNNGIGVSGFGGGTTGTGIKGVAPDGGYGVYGDGASIGDGVYGISGLNAGVGVRGIDGAGDGSGVYGSSSTGYGVCGESTTGYGIYALPGVSGNAIKADGYIALKQMTSTPSSVSEYGQLYTKSDGYLYYESGVSPYKETNLTNKYVNVSFINQTSVNIVHNLGYYPIVQTIDDSMGLFFPASVVHNSVNDFTITFDPISSGTIIY